MEKLDRKEKENTGPLFSLPTSGQLWHKATLLLWSLSLTFFFLVFEAKMELWTRSFRWVFLMQKSTVQLWQTHNGTTFTVWNCCFSVRRKKSGESKTNLTPSLANRLWVSVSRKDWTFIFCYKSLEQQNVQLSLEEEGALQVRFCLLPKEPSPPWTIFTSIFSFTTQTSCWFFRRHGRRCIIFTSFNIKWL